MVVGVETTLLKVLPELLEFLIMRYLFIICCAVCFSAPRESAEVRLNVFVHEYEPRGRDIKYIYLTTPMLIIVFFVRGRRFSL